MKVHAPWDLLTRYAEIFNLKMPIKVRIFFAHFAENAEFAVEHSLLGYEKRKIKV